jgi:hypothetical protein
MPWRPIARARNLAPFDCGFITVVSGGAVIVSNPLDGAARAALGLGEPLRVRH